MRHILLTATALVCALVVLVFGPEVEARILLTAMTVLALAFVIQYASLSDWRATVGGRSLMYVAGALALIGCQLISVWWLGDYAGRDAVRSITVSILVIALVHRLIALTQQQLEDRRCVEDSEGE